MQAARPAAAPCRPTLLAMQLLSPVGHAMVPVADPVMPPLVVVTREPLQREGAAGWAVSHGEQCMRWRQACSAAARAQAGAPKDSRPAERISFPPALKEALMWPGPPEQREGDHHDQHRDLEPLQEGALQGREGGERRRVGRKALQGLRAHHTQGSGVHRCVSTPGSGSSGEGAATPPHSIAGAARPSCRPGTTHLSTHLIGKESLGLHACPHQGGAAAGPWAQRKKAGEVSRLVAPLACWAEVQQMQPNT